MDNPWANGWSDESPNPALNDPKPIISSPSWTDSVAGEESDLASPSWSAGADVKWPEPSETQGSLWSHNFDSVHLDAWGSSTYKGISLERPSPHPPSPQEQAEQEKDSPTSSPMQQDVVPSSPKEVTITPPRGPSPALESPHLFASPEVFGSFETAANTRDTRDDDPWSSPISTFPLDTEEVEQWGSEWTAPKADEEESTEDELPDEWEVARQRKENMDRQVPPELLASILQKCEETSRDLWPDSGAVEDADKDDYKNNRYSGMEGVQGLAVLINRVAPEEMTLPPPIPFAKSFTAKSMAESIRLSRHIALAQLSPMSQLMASKGSTAWETSVKSRPEVVQDDLPVGWRVVESDKEAPSQSVDVAKGKKIGGGLLSFWGRRAAANTASDTNRERSMSPVQTASVSSRSSIDTVKPPLIASPATKPTSPIAATISTSASPPIIPVSSTPTTAATTASASTHTAQPDLFDPIEVQPAPSAVSRFLGRLSRAKPTTTSNQRHSLALSSDDLEFLSDFVPSASDEHDDDGHQLNALSSMIESSPLPMKLPPPLAPPPKPSSIGQPVSLGGMPKPQSNLSNDLDALLNLTTEPPAASRPLPPATSSVTLASTVTSPPLAGLTPVSTTSQMVDDPLSSFMTFSRPQSRSQLTTDTIPPSTTTHLSFMKPTCPPILPPPSGPSRTHTPKVPLVAPPTMSLLSDSFDEDDEEFSAFDALPPMPRHLSGKSQYESSFSSPTSKRSFFSQEPPNSSNLMSTSFDDFDDFVSYPAPSPSPPVPPAKSPPRQSAITPKVIPTLQRKVSVANHTRAEDVSEVDLLGDAPFMKQARTSPTGPQSVPTSVRMNSTSNGVNEISRLSSPPAPPNFAQPLMSFPSNPAQSSIPSFKGTTAPAFMPSVSKQSTGRAEGLSAQDLSFFEGL